jgi:hypothetical protein
MRIITDLGNKKKNVSYISCFDEKWIKNRCFICGEKFINSEERYIEKGNCCSKCNIKIARRLEEQGYKTYK